MEDVNASHFLIHLYWGRAEGIIHAASTLHKNNSRKY